MPRNGNLNSIMKVVRPRVTVSKPRAAAAAASLFNSFQSLQPLNSKRKIIFLFFSPNAAVASLFFLLLLPPFCVLRECFFIPRKWVNSFVEGPSFVGWAFSFAWLATESSGNPISSSIHDDYFCLSSYSLVERTTLRPDLKNIRALLSYGNGMFVGKRPFDASGITNTTPHQMKRRLLFFQSRKKEKRQWSRRNGKLREKTEETEKERNKSRYCRGITTFSV